jgi:UDP-2,4-diacetamido-2,4,6-trideoxy-beta-L-altropyranose hydrolase
MRLLLRADASVAVGTGHVMRCLALAQALQSIGHEPFLVSCQIPPELVSRLERENIPVVLLDAERGSDADIQQTLAVAKERDAKCCVLDGYVFGTAFQTAMREIARLCVIDDCAFADRYRADLLVNPNLFGTEEMYAGHEIGKFLGGHNYAILRREFWEVTEKPLTVKTRRILITMGGSDPDNATGKVVRAVKKLSMENIEIRAISGVSNPYWETLQVQASRPGHPVELLRNVQNMREQYEWCDVCIAAAGNTALELARVGVASLFLILVDNQDPVARAIRKYGFGKVLGWHEDVTEDAIRAAVRDLMASSLERDRMANWGRKVVDGQGAIRVAHAIGELVG